MKKHLIPIIKAPLVRGAFFLLLLMVVCAIPFARGQRQISGPAQTGNQPELACDGTWHAGPDMPSTAVRTVGVFFLNSFYVMGGRSMDGVGNDLTHPFECGVSCIVKSATYPDNQVSDMACGILNDSGTYYIYCVGGSAGGQTTATARVFRYNPMTDVIETIAAPWPGNSDGITLPGGFAVRNNKLYILGGFRINTGMTNEIWEFTPTTNVWVLKNAVLPVARGYIPTSTTTFSQSFIYTAGGSDWNGATLVDTSDSFRYDPIADSIIPIPNIPRATGETQAVPWGPDIYVMGGGRTPPNPSNEIDAYTNTWETVGHFFTPRRNFAAASDGGPRGGKAPGHMWVGGGYTCDGVTPLSSTELFCIPAQGSPTPGTPSPSPTCPTSTATPTATVSPTPTPTASPTPVGCALFEAFDNVTPPALPAGWIATNGINPDGILWQTSNSGLPSPPADSPPNAAWVNDPAAISDKYLDSPPIMIDQLENAILMFRNNYSLEDTRDGGVLEISIDGGPFQDAGGFILQGGYNGTISTCCGNPLAGRQAWTGSSDGFVTTQVGLPQGHTVALRWRMGSDNSGSSQGWRIDTVQTICERPTPTSTPTATPPPPTPTATATFTLTPTPTATHTPTATATATPTNTPSPTPTTTPTSTVRPTPTARPRATPRTRPTPPPRP